MTTEERWPQRILLEGAGMPEVDGMYERYEEDFCGVAQWKHVDRDMWIFYGGNFEYYWVIGHSHFSGDGYRYTHMCKAGVDRLNEAFLKGEKEYRVVAKNPLPPTEDDWGIYITGYDPPKFVGGVEPAPKVTCFY